MTQGHKCDAGVVDVGEATGPAWSPLPPILALARPSRHLSGSALPVGLRA